METVLIQVFNGLINGAFYALLSLGLAVIFGMLRVVNFMHGALYMLGAFGAFLLGTTAGVSFWWALLISPIAVAAVGYGLERTLLRRLYDLDVLYNLLLTFGLTLLIQDVMRLRFGIQGVPYPAPPQLQGAVVIGGMGSILGSVVTGFVVGALSALAAVYYPAAANLLVFVIMAVVLLLRPAGLFGTAEGA